MGCTSLASCDSAVGSSFSYVPCRALPRLSGVSVSSLLSSSFPRSRSPHSSSSLSSSFLIVVPLIPPHCFPPHSSSLSSYPHCCPPRSSTLLSSSFHQRCCFLSAMLFPIGDGDVVYYRRCCLLSALLFAIDCHTMYMCNFFSHSHKCWPTLGSPAFPHL